MRTFIFLLFWNIVSEVMYLALTLPTMQRKLKYIAVGDKYFFGFFFFIATIIGVFIQLTMVLLMETIYKDRD